MVCSFPFCSKKITVQNYYGLGLKKKNNSSVTCRNICVCWLESKNQACAVVTVFPLQCFVVFCFYLFLFLPGAKAKGENPKQTRRIGWGKRGSPCFSCGHAQCLIPTPPPARRPAGVHKPEGIVV